MNNKIFAVVILLICCSLLNYSCKSKTNDKTNDLAVINKGRLEKLFDEGWRFYHGDITGAETGNFMRTRDFRHVNTPNRTGCAKPLRTAKCATFAARR